MATPRKLDIALAILICHQLYCQSHTELYPVPVFGEQSPLQGVPFQVSEESPGNVTELSYTQIQIGTQIDVGIDSSCISSESYSDHSKGLSPYVSQSVPPSYEPI